MALTSQDFKKIGKLLDSRLMGVVTVKVLDEKLKNMVTSEMLDEKLKGLATIKEIDDRFSRLLKHVVTKYEFDTKIQELEQRISHLPTKDEFYNQMDKLMKELESIREEKVLTPTRSEFDDLEERVVRVEQQVFAS